MPLKTIGMFAGMSWASSVEYYRIINRTVQQRMGGSNSARIAMYSVNFQEMLDLRESGGWDAIAGEIIRIVRGLESSGADFFILSVNTMHIVADRVEEAVGIPLLHITDATAAEIKKAGMKKVGLLGTKYTMLEDFYRVRLRERHGIEAVIPGGEDVERLHRIILDELVIDRFLEQSRAEVLGMIDRLVDRGAEGIILGCTELPLLLSADQVPVPSFDTMTIHAVAAAEESMR